jgi:hypothetical protein
VGAKERGGAVFEVHYQMSSIKKYFVLFFIGPMLAACTLPFQQKSTPTFQFGVPVESESNALIAAQSGLKASFAYIEPLTVVKVEQMSFGDFRKFTGSSNNRPADIQVWLVIYFDDQWQVNSSPPGTPPAPFHGCVYVAINAADGMPLEVGGPVQPDQITGCDK